MTCSRGCQRPLRRIAAAHVILGAYPEPKMISNSDLREPVHPGPVARHDIEALFRDRYPEHTARRLNKFDAPDRIR
jgi:hypothetical protein